MKLHPVKFYQASAHDKELVTIAGAPLRMAGFPVPDEKNATLVLTLSYYMDDEPMQTPVTFRVNREPGKTLCTKEWPDRLPRPKCGDRKQGIPGEPVIVEVIHFTGVEKAQVPAEETENLWPTADEQSVHVETPTVAEEEQQTVEA